MTAVLHLSTRVEYLAVSPLSIPPSDASAGGVWVLQPWKNKPPTGMTVSSLPSSNLGGTHVWRVGVECQISSGLTGGGCSVGLCRDQMALWLLPGTQEGSKPTAAPYDRPNAFITLCEGMTVYEWGLKGFSETFVLHKPLWAYNQIWRLCFIFYSKLSTKIKQ